MRRGREERSEAGEGRRGNANKPQTQILSTVLNTLSEA
jgi:hypothetical protein